MSLKLNYGSGDEPLKGFINIDYISNSSVHPDLICDARFNALPFKVGEVEEVYFIHCIEHIERIYWVKILAEFHRVLKADGRLVIAYPEFEICAKYFNENFRGMRDYWRMTLYGRQCYPSDFHINPMRTAEVITLLHDVGFVNIKFVPEDPDEWNTFMTAHKGPKPLNREELYKKELFKLPV